MLLYEDAVSEAKFAFKGLTGKIKIGILSGLKINSFLPDYLDFMEKNYPNIEIILLRLSFIELTEKLVHEIGSGIFSGRGVWRTGRIRHVKHCFLFSGAACA